jgi:hypothetical protein
LKFIICEQAVRKLRCLQKINKPSIIVEQRYNDNQLRDRSGTEA